MRALVIPLGILLGVVVACATARRGEPVADPIPVDTATVARGERVFMTHCNQCHPGGDAGLGPAINNKPLPSGALAAQIRVGFGAMPGFSEEEIPADDLEALIEYLHVLHDAPHP